MVEKFIKQINDMIDETEGVGYEVLGVKVSKIIFDMLTNEKFNFIVVNCERDIPVELDEEIETLFELDFE